MLETVALIILIVAALILFYGIIVIHDIPYEIAKHRQHPHQDAIHYAGWVSLFTLHVLWPLLWIWATLYRSDRGWGMTHVVEDNASAPTHTSALEERLAQLEQDVASMKANQAEAPSDNSTAKGE